MPNGEFAARKLLRQRKRQRLLKKWLKRRKFKLKEKYDPVGPVPRAKGLVLQKFIVEQKQPHSGQIKCIRVQLIKNNKVVGALFFIILIIVLDFVESGKNVGYKKSVIETFAVIAAVLIFWIALIIILGTTTPLDVVPSCSMLPTLQRGDLIVLHKTELNKIKAPIINVSQSDYFAMLNNIANESLVCLAYNLTSGYFGESYKNGDLIGLFRIANGYPQLISNYQQSSNLVRYSCTKRGIVNQNGNVSYIAYTSGININGIEINGDRNNSIIVYQTVPNDTFYKLGDTYIVHRVYAIINASGDYYVLTKGDNNPELDMQDNNIPASINNTYGTVIASIPYIGYLKLLTSADISEPQGCNSTILH